MSGWLILCVVILAAAALGVVFWLQENAKWIVVVKKWVTSRQLTQATLPYSLLAVLCFVVAASLVARNISTIDTRSTVNSDKINSLAEQLGIDPDSLLAGMESAEGMTELEKVDFTERLVNNAIRHNTSGRSESGNGESN